MPTTRQAPTRPPAVDHLVLHAGAVVIVALAASVAGVFNQFAFDDVHLIQLNARAHSLGHWRELLTSSFWPPPFSQDLYRPLTSLLLAIQYAVGGGDPVVFRLVSYGLYAAASVAVLLLARCWLSPVASLGVALLFAAHPVHVEAVALGVGQAEIVVALLAATMVLRYVAARRRGMPETRAWLELAVLFLAASLTKEQGLLTPGLLVLVELVPPTGVAPAPWRRLAGGYAALVAAGALVLLARRAVLGGEVAGTFTAEALSGLGVTGRALTMLPVVAMWVRLLAWPVHLQADYSPQEITAATGAGPGQMAGVLLLLLLVLAAAWGARRAPAVAFGLGWCAIALFPVSNLLLPTGIVLAERTLFLPSIGFLLAVGGGATWFLQVRPAAGRMLAGVAAVALVAGVARSVERQRVWRNEAFFSVRMVQDAPRSYRAHRAFAEVLFGLGRDSLALESYQRALALAPHGFAWQVHNDLARRFRAMGAAGPESEQLVASLAERPDQEDARGYLVAALLVLGRYKEAAAQADTAIARGGNPTAFLAARAVADSAERVSAPAGTIRVGVRSAPSPTRR